MSVTIRSKQYPRNRQELENLDKKLKSEHADALNIVSEETIEDETPTNLHKLIGDPSFFSWMNDTSNSQNYIGTMVLGQSSKKILDQHSNSNPILGQLNQNLEPVPKNMKLTLGLNEEKDWFWCGVAGLGAGILTRELCNISPLAAVGAGLLTAATFRYLNKVTIETPTHGSTDVPMSAVLLSQRLAK